MRDGLSLGWLAAQGHHAGFVERGFDFPRWRLGQDGTTKEAGMILRDEDWFRLTTAPDVENGAALVGSWSDKSCREELWQAGEKLYRKRSWMKSSVMAAGEVWFLFWPEGV